MDRTTYMYIGLIVVAVLLVVAGLYGLGDGVYNSNNQNRGPTNQTNDRNLVRMINIQFDPRTIQVEAGETVTWRNEDNVEHTITGFGVDVSVGPGEIYRHTFQETGTYNYDCTLHPGMSGTVEVVS
ncbi:MAG: plastocyanin/azurin family copper-binding protein [Candidatus Aenigmatarchaeota archaeon]